MPTHPTTWACMHCDHRAPIRGQVRCCSDTGLSSWPMNRRPGCSVWGESDAGWPCAWNKTFSEAEAICQAAGARLCTVAELADGCAVGTGCGFDSELVWGAGRAPTQQQRPVECGRPGVCTNEAAGLRDPDELHEVHAPAPHHAREFQTFRVSSEFKCVRSIHAQHDPTPSTGALLLRRQALSSLGIP